MSPFWRREEGAVQYLPSSSSVSTTQTSSIKIIRWVYMELRKVKKAACVLGSIYFLQGCVAALPVAMAGMYALQGFTVFKTVQMAGGGDVIALTAHVCKASNKEAAAVLAEYVAKQTPATPAPKQEAPSKGQNATLEPLDYLETAHDLLDELGIPENVAEAVGIGYAPKGIMRGTVAIPIRLPSGALIGYVGITEAKTPKAWRLP